MTNYKFNGTPGPWHSFQEDDGEPYEVNKTETGLEIGRMIICEGLLQGRSEGQHDADLIAEAPAMLELLYSAYVEIEKI